jgi:lipopolysaccharide transport system ATP-binding protein
MSNIVIKAENLGKAYQLGQIGTGTISRDLERWYARIRGKEDPFLRIGETNDRSVVGNSDIVWSLRDLNFEIEQGNAVGIIGRNGAGKSTLLKILSKVTAPTIGKISGKGRIASLLEVGTGFHPELSGRENIFLNGAILGMRKKEIAQKFDEIVDFAGIERYIDTPVKRYSSGMYVRLAFAVAAHLESEILIVDEVLAVGDAEFQKKCLGKMGEVSKGEGRTVLFVSHNMASIKELCTKGLLLENGQLSYSGNIVQTIDKYTDNDRQSNASFKSDQERPNVYIQRAELFNDSLKNTNIFEFDKNFLLKLGFKNIDKIPINCQLTIEFKNKLNHIILVNHYDLKDILNTDILTLNIHGRTFLPGEYVIDINGHVPNVEFVFRVLDKLTFSIEMDNSIHRLFNTETGGIYIPNTFL